MAMEYKTVNVPNELEAKTISELGCFGWTLKSSQRVFNQESHNEYSYSGNYFETVTTTVDFTKLVFERDKSLKNYDQIISLEKSYYYWCDQMDKTRSRIDFRENLVMEHMRKIDVRSPLEIGVNLFFIFGFLLLSPVFYFFGNTVLEFEGSYGVFPISIWISAIATIVFFVKKRSANKEWYENGWHREYFDPKWNKMKEKPEIKNLLEGTEKLEIELEEYLNNVVECMNEAEKLLNS